MNRKLMRTLAATVLLAGLATGCATTDQLKQMEADIAKAQESAAAAMTTANEANRKADAAMAAARDAQAAADRCAEKCDRMFEKAMAK